MLNWLMFCKIMATILRGQFWDIFLKKNKKNNKKGKYQEKTKFNFRARGFLGLSQKIKMKKNLTESSLLLLTLSLHVLVRL